MASFQEFTRGMVHKRNGEVHGDEGLIGIKQCAPLIGMSVRWLAKNYELLPHIRIGTGRRPRILFRPRDVAQWIAEHRREP